MIKHKYIVAITNMLSPRLEFFDNLREAKERQYELLDIYSQSRMVKFEDVDVILAEVLDWKEIKAK